MTVSSLLITLIIGAIAGWLASMIVKGHGQGLLVDIVVGIVGAFIASFLFPALGWTMGSPFLGAIISSTLGAVILLIILRLVRRA